MRVVVMRLTVSRFTMRVMLVMHRRNVTVGIPSETIIVNGMIAPIRMETFPVMKTLQSD